jgi:F-type H+-transporting ATPase subunit b
MPIDWFTVAAQLINFLVLVWLMKRYLYQPILAAIAAREGLIAAGLDDAAARQAAAQGLGAELAAKNAAFDAARAALLGEATAAAQAANAALRKQGEEDDAAQRARHAAALAAEGARLCEAVTRQAHDDLLAVLRQTLADLGDESLEAAMVRAFVRRLAAMDAAAQAALAAALLAAPASAELRSAFPLDGAQQAALTDALHAAGVAPPALRFVVAPDLLCGIEFRLEGWSLAWNLDSYLSGFARHSAALLQAGGEADAALPDAPLPQSTMAAPA